MTHLRELTPAEADAAADEIYERWLDHPEGDAFLTESVDLNVLVAVLLGSYGQCQADALHGLGRAVRRAAADRVKRWTSCDIAAFRDRRALAAELVAGLL